jgi:hypothetical protein
MTNEYKENLINYFTGNMPEETGINTPYFIDEKSVENNLDTYLTDNLGSHTIIGQLKGTNSDYSFIYGNYQLSSKGYIIILDSDQNIIKLITKYKSGTDFGTFLALNIDENGNVYGIDNYNSNLRFIMLNNFLISNNNEVVLRQSYYINYSLTDITPNSLRKVIGEATYFMLGKDNDGEGNYVIKLIQLTINVGSENEWNIYTIASSRFEITTMCYDYIVSKINNAYNAEIYFASEVSQGINIYKILFDGTSLTKTQITTGGSTESETMVVVSSDKFYYVSDTLDENFIWTTSITEYDKGTKVVISERTAGETYIDIGYKIAKINNILISYLKKYNTNTYYTTFSLGIFYNGSFAEQQVFEITQNLINVSSLQGINIFNLYKIALQIGDECYIISTILSDLYSGLSFIDKNSLFPYSGILYNENNEVIFARNLYDKTIINNTTESSIEVPNNYLNENIIQKQELMSKNNNILVSNNQPITKNIYEDLFINYFNTINVIDENNSSAPIINQIGAIRINNSVSNLIDYEDAQCTKARINYADNTNQIKNLYWNSIDDTHKQTIISIYVDKPMLSIDFISNDETTIYLTLPLNVEEGKYYVLNQKLRIGE